VSLTAHGLFLLAAARLPSREGRPAEEPASVGLLVLDSGPGGRLTLDDPSPAPRRGRPEDAEPQDAFTATVEVPPVTTPVPAGTVVGRGAETAGVVGGPTAGDGPGDGGEGGGGHGRGHGSSLFPTPAEGRRIVYVIDRSISMGLAGALDVARTELLAGLRALPAEACFQVILYNRRAEPLCVGGRTDLLPATAENCAAVARLVEGMRAEGATDHLAALRRALALGPDTIFFVTDADEMTFAQVRAVTLLNRGRAAIHAVQLGDGGPARDDEPLPTLARANRGTHRVVPLP
jgi:hypothetical protein